MGAPGLTSPIRTQGFENLQLNAGVFVLNLDMSAINSAEAMKAKVTERIAAGTTLGMTSGGGTFTISREARLPDVDGRRYLHKGAQFVDSMDGNLTSTLIEITPANWQYIIGTTEPLASNTATKKAYKIKTVLDDAAYINNIVWVGDTADGKFVAIEFDNAMNTADIAFTFADKNEGKLPFELHAHQSQVLDYDVAPFAVHFFGSVYDNQPDGVANIGGGMKISAWGGTLTELPDAFITYNAQGAYQLGDAQDMVAFKATTNTSLPNISYRWGRTGAYTAYNNNDGILYSADSEASYLEFRFSGESGGSIEFETYVIVL